MWENEENVTGAPPAPASMAAYREAVGEFTANATALIEHIPLFTKARDAYEQAVRASAEVRNILDAGDETLRLLMTDLEQAVNIHVSKPAPEKRRSEPIRIEPPKTEGRSPFAANE